MKGLGYSYRYQRGIGVLLVAIVLLGVATVLALFSVSVGIYDQRTATNESRYRLANAAAQAGLDQGLEFIKANTSDVAGCWLFPNLTSCTVGPTARWTRCAAATQTSPCGAIAPGVGTSALRANYFYYNDANARAAGDDPKSLNFSLDPVTGSSTGQAVTSMGNFSVDYQVNALLCLIDTSTPSNVCLTPSEFNSQYVTGPLQGQAYGANNNSSSGAYTVTMVSRSRLAASGATTDTENAQVVLKDATASYRLLGKPPDVPLVASNQVTALGDSDIVANPNGGGTGIPLSIWSAACIHVSNVSNTCGSSQASFSSCYADEFFQTGTAVQYFGSTICPAIGTNSGKCGCSGIANLVGNNNSPFGLGVLSGHTGSRGMAGPDLLGVNVGGILPDAHFFPLYPLNIFAPADKLDDTPFEYVFATDVADSTSHMLAGAAPNTTIDAATVYLAKFKALADCSTLNGNSHGFYWHAKGQGDCNLPQGAVGRPDHPVTLVAQTDLNFGSQTTFFGIVFVRSPAGIGDQITSTSAGYDIKATGGAQLYGAMVLEGEARLTGAVQLIYDVNTLRNVINGPDNTRLGVLPGSWSDAGRIDVANNNMYSEN
jgi:type II secretory pathway pseudopilin PulG